MRTDRPLPYGRQWIDERDVEAVARVLRGDWLTTGPVVEAFESALAAALGARRAVAVSSGTAALHAAYFAAGLRAGDEVVTSPLTFVATASVALQLGARVRFADVDPATGNLDPAAAERALGDAARLLVPVDYAGHPADYVRLREVAQRRGVALVADGAHSLGAARDGRPVAALADLTATSFHPVKAITTGEGGAVLTDREDWAERAAMFRNHGIVRDPRKHRAGDAGPWHYEVQALGLNYRLPDVLCALGLSQLSRLPAFLERRRAIAAAYSRALADAPGLELPVQEQGVEPAWHLYVVRVLEAPRRRALFERLRECGLGVQLHYPPVHLHPLYRDLGHRPGEHPAAEDFAARALSLPIFPRMGDAEVERVVDTVREAARALL